MPEAHVSIPARFHRTALTACLAAGAAEAATGAALSREAGTALAGVGGASSWCPSTAGPLAGILTAAWPASLSGGRSPSSGWCRLALPPVVPVGALRSAACAGGTASATPGTGSISVLGHAGKGASPWCGRSAASSPPSEEEPASCCWSGFRWGGAGNCSTPAAASAAGSSLGGGSGNARSSPRILHEPTRRAGRGSKGADAERGSSGFDM